MASDTKARPSQDDPFFNIAEAAEYLNQSDKWVRRNLEEGKLPKTKMGRLVRLRKSDLDAWAREHTSAPGQ